MRYQRRMRRRNFRPQPESLESRIALSAQIGVNLQSNSVYDSDPIWTDLHNVAYNWVPLTGSSLALSADGYPLANASVGFDMYYYPNGNYEFSYTGSGTVTFSGDGQLAGPVTVSGGVTSGTVVVNANGATASEELLMQVTGVNPANPMDNFHLMMPGYGNGTTPEPMFTPAFLKALAPFKDIRFLGWDDVNNSTLSTWANRVTPTSFTTDGAGVPYEDMIDLCNVTQEDMWINIPALATPQFVQSLAQLIYADLDPNLNVYVEYSNETWNSGFEQFSQVLTAAQANPLVTQSSNSSMMVAQQTAYEEVLAAQTFDQTFGAESSRVRPIMAGDASWSQVSSWEFQFIQQNYGTPSQYVWGDAIAPYVGIASGDDVAGLTLNQLFADLDQALTSSLDSNIEPNAAIAQEYGVPLVAYEGGQSLYPGNSDLNYAVMAAAQNDPRMYQIYVTMINEWTQAGGTLFDALSLDGPPSQYGFWGMLPNVTAPGSQKYDALVSELETPGDANFDGIVDYADFQTLEANYGDTNAYWEQGDFNDDGTVNGQDLNILRQNLDPAGFTLSQFAQQALFGQLSTVIPGQSLEYDGYGVTYASSLPVAASSGTVELNENSQGTAIVLSGATYSEGLGVLANSSVSLTLNGQYSQFESTIGVDGNSNTTSSVIFDVYGDGQLLYQSPTLTYASGAIPIDVNVAGVTTLTLTMSATSGSSPSADHAVWADARLISTANFGATQPYTLTWQLSQNGTVLSTQTADSFVFGAISGTYILTLTVADAQGDTATASTSVVVTAPTTSASYVMLDSHTEGNWIGTYGTQGYDVIGGPSSLPNYATVTPLGTSTYTWSAGTSNLPALELAASDFGVAACWYSQTSFTVNVNLTDGQSHDLTLYAVDYDNQGRSEEIQIINAATGAVLDSRKISSFSDGIYLQWVVSGDIDIVVTSLDTKSAVLSGLFFDPPTAAVDPVSELDGITEGNWIGTYGTLGYDVIGNATSLPSGVTIIPSGTTNYAWGATTNVSVLENASGTSRTPACWYADSTFSVAVNVTAGLSYDLTLYALDYEPAGRIEKIQLFSAATGSLLDTETISSFANGVYLTWGVVGSVVIDVTSLTPGVSAELNGVFLEPGSSATATSTATATYVSEDTTTEGNWINTYGNDGYDVISSTNSYVNLPAGVTVTPAGQTMYTWPTPGTSVTQALELPGGASRIAACWYSSTSFTVDVDITNGQSYNLELYVLDYSGGNSRSEQIEISDATSGLVLSIENVSNFSNGAYLTWTISSNVLITITNRTGTNAVLSGLFFNPTPTSTPAGTATFLNEDTTTEGNWINTYGNEGYDVISSTNSYVNLPAGVTVTPAGEAMYTWPTPGSSATQALELPGGASQIAACWDSSTSFTVDVDITNGESYNLELYVLDYNGGNSRSEQIRFSDPATEAVLSNENVSNFSGGAYLTWTISGNVLITITRESGANAVLSGLFFDPSESVAAVTATFLHEDTKTQGNWVNTYGNDGYDVISSTSSYVNLPAGVTITPAGEATYTWPTPANNATQALEVAPDGLSRIAACWYSSTSFTVDVDITNGQTYNLELYFLDYNGGNARSEQIQISSAVTGAVLSTETVSDFSSGAYLNWTISGNVQITITTESGANAVLSGLFFDPVSVSNAIVNPGPVSAAGGEVGTSKILGIDELASSISGVGSQAVPTAGATSSTMGAILPTAAAPLDPKKATRTLIAANLRDKWSG